MGKVFVIGGLFILAGLCEIGGGYLVWGWLRDNKPVLWGLVGGLVLALYGVVAAMQPIPEFGRVYAAYGGVFIALAISCSMLVDGFQPDKYDVVGALPALAGVAVMVFGPRG